MNLKRFIIVCGAISILVGPIAFAMLPQTVLAQSAQGTVMHEGCNITDVSTAIKINMTLPGITQKVCDKDTVEPCLPSQEKIVVKNLPCFIIGIYTYFAGVAGILATVMIMYGGLKYVTSFGNQQRITEAKDTVFSAMTGLVLTLVSYILLYWINPNLTSFKLEIEPIIAIEQEENQSASAKGAPAKAWYGANISEYDELLSQFAERERVDRNWLKAIMLVESNGDPNAVSPAKACGLMQLLPSTAEKYKSGTSCQDLKNPALNIEIAALYLADLQKNTCPTKATYKSGRVAPCEPSKTMCQPGVMSPWVIAAYNGGEGANCSSVSCPGLTWWECEENTGYEETRRYVNKVNEAYYFVLATSNW